MVVIDFVADVRALYRTADVFVFPSLEEGGPQVTYEACGCGLPVITTPMGAAESARQNQEGFDSTRTISKDGLPRSEPWPPITTGVARWDWQRPGAHSPSYGIPSHFGAGTKYSITFQMVTMIRSVRPLPTILTTWTGMTSNEVELPPA